MPVVEDTEKRRRTKHGCLPCRIRKKRCDLRIGTCVACERNVLLCSWPSKSSLCSTTLGSRGAKEVVRATQSSGTISPHPSLAGRVLESAVSSLLYQHWIENSANVYSVQRGLDNGFIMILPRLAFQYPDTVLQSLLALSGTHFGNTNISAEVEAAAYTHLGITLRSLKHGLTVHASQPDSDPIPLLATTLVLCFVEVCHRVVIKSPYLLSY
jgi:hypothetical protein